MTSNVQPLKPEDPEAPESPVTTGKVAKIADFSLVLAQLAQKIGVQALKLPKQQFDMQLDAFKACTAYQAMLNRATESDEGGGILDIRAQLETPTPEPKEEEEAEDDGAENA